jgi:anti-anti-sigma regulatory factor
MRETVVDVQADPKRRTTRVIVQGEIDETTDLRPALAPRTDTIVVDLGGVRRINSAGLREWLAFVRKLDQEGKKLVLERCAPAIVGQINMLPEFIGDSGEVLSIMLPFCCLDCGGEKLTLMDLQEPGSERLLNDSPTCPACGSLMEFDDVAETYLLFRNDQ